MGFSLDHVTVAVVAFLTTVLGTPLVRWGALRAGAVAVPRDRDVHRRPTPKLGGLALFAGVMVALAVASRLPSFVDLFRLTNEPEAIVLAAVLIVGVGVVDDVRGMSAPAKLAGQILAAGLLVLFGVALRYVYLPGGVGQTLSLSPDWSALLTVLVVVAMMNAVNLIDGLDGLAAGVVAIAAVALLVYTQVAPGLLEVPSTAPLLLAAVVGACLGFLVHNFNPASIFMGDTGAQMLGLLLGAAGVSAVGSTFQPSGGTFAAASIPVLVPVFVLAVPFLDTAWTIVRRLLQGRPVFSADKEHLHHRLLEIGHSHKRAVLIMYYWSGLLAFTAVAVSRLSPEVVGGILAGGVGLALLVAITGRLVRRSRVVRVR